MKQKCEVIMLPTESALDKDGCVITSQESTPGDQFRDPAKKLGLKQEIFTFNDMKKAYKAGVSGTWMKGFEDFINSL